MIKSAWDEALSRVGHSLSGAKSRIADSMRATFNAAKTKLHEIREDRKRFPTRWLTYKKRVCDDVDHFMSSQGEQDFNYEAYVDRLSPIVRQLEGWQIKLISLQTIIIIIIIVGFFEDESSSISFLGTSIPYSREILIMLSFTIGALLSPVTAAKELRIIIVQRIVENKYKDGEELLMKLAHVSSFNFEIYIARNFDRWIFSRILKKILISMAFISGTLTVFLEFLLSTTVMLLVVADIWNNPEINEPFFTAFFIYCLVALLFSVMTTIIYWVPLPHKDQSALQRLEELRETDAIAYRALLEELYGDAPSPDNET